MNNGFEIFYAKYQLPKFGTEGEFQDEEHTFIVSTKGGRNDAKKACEYYHKNCRVISVQSRLEVLCNVNVPIKKKSSKKGK